MQLEGSKQGGQSDPLQAKIMDARERRDYLEDAMANLATLSEFEQEADARLRGPVAQLRESWPLLLAEHQGATAALAKMLTLAWVRADDECCGKVTVAWGPDGRARQMRVRG